MFSLNIAVCKVLSRLKPKKKAPYSGALYFDITGFCLVEDIAKSNLEHPALTDVKIGVVGFGRVSVINLHH